MIALHTFTGAHYWRAHIAQETSAVTGAHYFIVQPLSCSRTPVCSAATIDGQRGFIYVGTGQNRPPPTSSMSDAISPRTW